MGFMKTKKEREYINLRKKKAKLDKIEKKLDSGDVFNDEGKLKIQMPSSLVKNDIRDNVSLIAFFEGWTLITLEANTKS